MVEQEQEKVVEQQPLQYPLFLFIYALVVVLVLLLVCCYLVMCLVLFMLCIEDTAPFKFWGVLVYVR